MTFWLLLLLTFFFVRYLLPLVLRAVLGGFVRKQMRNGGFGGPSGPFGPGRAGPGQRAGADASAQKPGEVRVDFVPPAAGPAGGKPTGFKGGEYVDYEEVK